MCTLLNVHKLVSLLRITPTGIHINDEVLVIVFKLHSLQNLNEQLLTYTDLLMHVLICAFTQTL